MAANIEYPSTPSGTPEEQLVTMYNYLYRMAEALNANLAEIGSPDLTDGEREIMNRLLPAEEQAKEGTPAFSGYEAETLKSLIIKTASFVQKKTDEYRMNLLGEYVASGKFGRYVRNTNLKLDITPEGIQQDYTFEAAVQGERDFQINTRQFIRTGLLRTESSVPIYGVQVGKDICEFEEDGTVTYHDENKVAELTADALTFYTTQNQTAVPLASLSGTKLSFYVGGVEFLYIDANGIHAASDMAIESGKYLNVNSGAYLDVKSGGNLNVKSGGDMTIEGGGDLYINSSANLDVKNGGKLNVKSGGDLTIEGGGDLFINSSGNLDIKNGGKLNIKSGGDLTIEGGGDLLINSSGKLKLYSGGTLDVDSNNFVLSSADKKMQAGNWIFDQYGIRNGASGYLLGICTSGRNLYFTLSQSSPGAPVSDAQMRLTTANAIYRDQSISAEPRLDFGQGNFYGLLGDNHFPLQEVWTRYICYWGQKSQSSRQVKDHIEDLPEMGDVIDGLNPVSYEYKKIPGERRFGLIWEDTVDVLPEICSGITAEDPEQRSIDYMDLIAVLLKEIKSLRRRVAALEAKEE